MREEFRRLGLKRSLKGTKTLERLVNGKKVQSDLLDKEIDEILEAWDARKYVPIHKLHSAISSKPGHVEGETEAEYNRRHVGKIVAILKGLINTPCT